MPKDKTGILELPLINRIRRNHGLEHATLHMLARRFPDTSMGGYSNLGGFWIAADVPIEAVRESVDEALRRMKAGESKLAVHPNCGTNFITTGTLAGVAGAASLFGAGKRWQDKLGRLPLAASMATLVLIISRPLGLSIQEHITTSGDPGSLEVVEIIKSQRGGMTFYRVTTRG
jgi:Domain of unknown function (DUF6391)